jgi:hypothetical protein
MAATQKSAGPRQERPSAGHEHDAEVGEVSDGERSRVDQRRPPVAEASGEALVGDAAIQHLFSDRAQEHPDHREMMK